MDSRAFSARETPITVPASSHIAFATPETAYARLSAPARLHRFRRSIATVRPLPYPSPWVVLFERGWSEQKSRDQGNLTAGS